MARKMDTQRSKHWLQVTSYLWGDALNPRQSGSKGKVLILCERLVWRRVNMWRASKLWRQESYGDNKGVETKKLCREVRYGEAWRCAYSEGVEISRGAEWQELSPERKEPEVGLTPLLGESGRITTPLLYKRFFISAFTLCDCIFCGVS